MSSPKKPAPKNLEKLKMATINEVYNRIIWDSRLNRNLFVTGFHERVSDAIREKPLAHWDGSGDIPWHRIRYIRCGDMVVWDRDQHLDLISTDQLPEIAWKQDILQPSDADLAALLINNRAEFKSRNIYQYQGNDWQVLSIPSQETITAKKRSPSLNTLKIASYNILCNLYEAENIQTEKRMPAILHELQKCAADIIALQEVTPEFVAELLAADWAKNYLISESIAGDKVKPYGNLLMSTLPFNLVEHQFSAHKRVLVGTWNLNNQLFRVAVVHLTGTRAENSLQIRSRQLATVIDYLQQQSGNCCIVGDFNIRGEEQQELFDYGNFGDVWQELHPDQEGYTFDPAKNPLAMMLSLAGKAARFDRILLRNAGNVSYKPLEMNLFGCEAIAGTKEQIFPSDHFGICGVLEFHRGNIDSGASSPSSRRKTQAHKDYGTDLTTIKPTYQSAIVIIPADDVLPAIQEIRQKYDPRFTRWMPHITLLCGFLPDAYFAEAVEIIAAALAELSPFTINLSGFHNFSHQKTTTAWLNPVVVENRGKNALWELQSTLQQLFPQCYEQSTRSNSGFTPHLTVGQFSTSAEAIAKLPQWHPVKFQVDSVALVSRRDDQPCRVRYVVGLGNNYVAQHLELAAEETSELVKLVNQLEPQLTEAEKSHRETVLAILKQACSECLEFEASLHLLGSARLGVDTLQSDLDVVCLIPDYLAGEAFLARVCQKLVGLCEKTQLILDAKVPVLRSQLDGISIDLLYAQVEVDFANNMELPINGNLSSLKSKIRHQKSIIGCWEADVIIDLLEDKFAHVSGLSNQANFSDFSLADFRIFLRAIRAWAKSRGIYGNSWGFLGGFSFSLLAAWSCLNLSDLDVQSPLSARVPPSTIPRKIELLLHNFFQLLNTHNWNRVITLTDAGSNYEIQHPRDWLGIITSIEPCQNTARNVTRSTAKILKAEFHRGAKITEQILAGTEQWATLYTPVNLQQESEQFLEISIASPNASELETTCRHVEAHIIGLIIQLERIDVFVRPGIGKNQHHHQNHATITLGLNVPQTGDRRKIISIAENFFSQFQSNSNIITYLIIYPNS